MTSTTADPTCAPAGEALADPTRIQVLAMIEASTDQAACVCDLTEPLGCSQPTVSHHLKILVDAGILAREKRAVRAWFSIREDSRAVADTVAARLARR